MLKRCVLILSLLLVVAGALTAQSVAQPAEQPLQPFNDFGAMAGLVLEATGFGLVIGGGAATSISLDVALVFMQIAPLFSASGAWVSQGFMEKTNRLWLERGLGFDASSYLNNSRTAAIVTTVFAAGAILAPLIGEVGIYISLGCTAVSVVVDMYALYAIRSAWLQQMNTAILASDLDWRNLP